MRGHIRRNRHTVRKALAVLLNLGLFLLSGSFCLAEGQVEFRWNDYVFWQSTEPAISMYVEMTNRSDQPADPSLMEITVRDGEGNECYGYLANCPCVTVPPGRTFCFLVNWIGYAGDDPSIELRYPENADPADGNDTFTESECILREKDGQFQGVLAEFRNPTSETIQQQPAEIALFNAEGEIRYVKAANTGALPIGPGGSSWIYWSPFEENPVTDMDFVAGKEKIASARAYTVHPVQENGELRCGDYLYRLKEDGTACLLRYTGKEQELRLPDRLDGSRVTEIETEAFRDCNTLISLMIPEGVQTLKSDAITQCEHLEQVSLPASLQRIDDSQFTECPCLAVIRLDPGNTAYVADENVLYRKKDGMLIRYPQGRKGTSYTVQHGTSVLAAGCFQGCGYLTKIILPPTLKEIRHGAFSNCVNLTNAAIPETVVMIEEYAFQGTSISSAVLPKGIRTLERYVFRGCQKLTQITLPEGLTAIEEGALRETAIPGIQLPDSLVRIGDLAFMSCRKLTGITIPEAVQTIGIGAFGGCDALEEIRLPESQSRFTMTDGMLCDREECRLISALALQTGEKIRIPDGIQKIDAIAFSGNRRIKEVTLPDTVAELGDYAFADCTGMIRMELSSNLVKLGTQVFQSCTFLESIRLPKGITEIPTGAFDHCLSLTSVSLPSTLTHIGIRAFSYCERLTEISIPESVEQISYAAFAFCSELKHVNFPASVQSIGEKVFEKSPKVTVKVVPGSFGEQYCLENEIRTFGGSES